MKKRNLYVIIIVIVLFIAVLTNPDSIKHKEAVKNKLHEYLQKKLQEHSDTSLGETGGALGAMFADVLVDRIVNNVVSSDNYVVLSTTKVTWEGKSKVIGIGIFGNVFITGNLQEAVDNGLATK